MEEVPPEAHCCKTLVVACTTESLERRFVVVVLMATSRLSLVKLRPWAMNTNMSLGRAREALRGVDWKPDGLASPEEAEQVVGCSMGCPNVFLPRSFF